MAAGDNDGRSRQASDWRTGLRRRITWSLLLKLLALLTLWALFFSTHDRIHVDAEDVSGRLATDPVTAPFIPPDPGTDHD